MSCLAYQTNLNQSKAAGRSYRGGETLLRYVVSAPLADDKAIVLVNYEAKELLVVDASGQIVKRLPADAKVVVNIDLRRSSSSWLVAEVTQS